MSKSHRPSRRSRGFSLLEVVIAIAVLTIGVSAMAALSAAMLTRGLQSKYMNMAGTLASEKLEDLNRWHGSFSSAGVDTSDPEICVAGSDTQEGSLTADVLNHSITCGPTGATVTEPVDYADDVSIDIANSNTCPNPTDGCFGETTSSTTSGVTTYYTTYHSPDGSIPGNQSGTQSPVSSTTAPAGMTTFHRRWVIEPSPAVNGTAVPTVRRITVLVTYNQTGSGQLPMPNTSFQMSMIRP